MFLSAVVPLTVARTVEVPEFLGRECYAFFLSQVERQDRALAEEMHNSPTMKYFTVSPLMYGDRWQRPSILEEGSELWVRFTSTKAELTNVLLTGVLPNLWKMVKIGPLWVQPGMPVVYESGHQWAGIVQPAALIERWFGSNKLPDSVTIRFATPTISRRIHRNWLLPTPEVVFASLLERWNWCGAYTLDESIIRLIEADVTVAYYTLQTSSAPTSNERSVGWQGNVRYRIYAKEKGLRAIIHTLADFALYSGIGYRTTQGMGQTRVLR